ncbi:outer membrane lipoprotein-sorting protein [Endothiovibrio diazotrophicus]
MNRSVAALLFSFATLLSVSALAETDEEKGLAIAQEFDRRDQGFQDSRAEMTMTLRNRNGDESVRQLRVNTLEMSGDGDRSMSIFDEPLDVKGTAMLTYSHGLEPDDQWLYLPALKRVKRISSRNKSGPFMGSEFAYEDIGSQEVEKYHYRYLRDETVDGMECFVLEEVPAYEYSGYTRRVVWIDQAEYRPIQVEFYDRKEALLKVLHYRDYRQYLDRYWRAAVMEMENRQTGKRTTLRWDHYRFQTGLTERDFDKNALKRAR